MEQSLENQEDSNLKLHKHQRFAIDDY